MRPTDGITGLLIAFTLWAMFVILKDEFESNIPIVYYVALLAYLFELGGLDPLSVYSALVCGFLLRFEFVNHPVTRLLQLLELTLLTYILWTCSTLILD